MEGSLFPTTQMPLSPFLHESRVFVSLITFPAHTVGAGHRSTITIFCFTFRDNANTMNNRWVEVTTFMTGQKHARKKSSYFLAQPLAWVPVFIHVAPSSTFLHGPSFCAVVPSFVRWEFLLSPWNVERSMKTEHVTILDSLRVSSAERRIQRRIFGLSHSHSTSPIFPKLNLGFLLDSYILYLSSFLLHPPPLLSWSTWYIQQVYDAST